MQIALKKYNTNNEGNQMLKGRVKVYSGDVIVYQGNNIITDEATTFVAGKIANKKGFDITHIYGQWGEVADFPEGTGPFFTPTVNDKIVDLTSTNIFTTDAKSTVAPIEVATELGQNRYYNNGVKIIATFPNNVGKAYIGAGLVCEPASLLLGHIAFKSIVKKANADIVIVWDWFERNPDA